MSDISYSDSNFNDLQFANYIHGKLDNVEKQLTLLEERITHLEGSATTASTISTEETLSMPGITNEKMTAVNLILSNKTIGWKAALRKILVAVVGVEELSKSCAKGKKMPRTSVSIHKQLDRLQVIIFLLSIGIIHVIFSADLLEKALTVTSDQKTSTL